MSFSNADIIDDPVDITNITEIPDKIATKIFFDASTSATDTTFGRHRNITGFLEITGIDNQFYRSIAFTDTNSSIIDTQTAEIIRSFQKLSSTDGQTEPQKTGPNNNTSTAPYDNPTKGITLRYPSGWGYYDYPTGNRVLFYSPIDFYFMGTSYIILVDVPSSYDGPTDFISKAMWWHKFSGGKWAKIIEETSSAGPTRTLESYNFTEFFKKKENWEGHVFMPISLQTLNSPNEYIMVFLTGGTYVLNGLLCDVFQSTDTVYSPPPKLSILLSSNSSSVDPSMPIYPLIGPPISPSQKKSIEVMVKSYSDIPYTITFDTSPLESEIVDISFTNSTLDIPRSGWVTTQLDIESKWNLVWIPPLKQRQYL
jgi:hypothetical protein